MNTIAVLTREAIITNRRGYLVSEHVADPLATVGALATACALRGIDQIWIHREALDWLGLPAQLPHTLATWTPFEPEHFWADGDEWDIGEPTLRWWYRCRSKSGRATVTVAIPAYNVVSGVWGCWDELGPNELIFALTDFQTRIGMLPVAGPGHTAESMLRRSILRSKALGGELPHSKMPPAALSGPFESDLIWVSPEPVEAEIIDGWDRSAHYLAAVEGLSVGIGDPEHFGSGWPPIVVPWGYYLAQVGAPRSWPFGFQAILPGLRWHTAPTLELAAELGCEIGIEQSWQWPARARWLDPWAAALKAAGQGAEGPVKAAVKAMYTQALGRFESKLWDRTGDSLYRPDIRHHVVARARANMIRSFLRARKLDPNFDPFLVYVDTFLSKWPAPFWAMEERIREGPGQWHHIGFAGRESIAGELASRHRNATGIMRAFNEAVEAAQNSDSSRFPAPESPSPVSADD